MEPAKIRTVPFSPSDKARFWEIERDPQISRKMPGKIQTEKDLEDWLSQSIIYGICSPENEIIGFVQLYEMGDSLIKRLLDNKLIASKKNLYEISFALPEKWRYANGLVSSAVRQICALYPNFQIIAFASVTNEKSIRVLEHCGFSFIGRTKYHANEKIENLVYINKV